MILSVAEAKVTQSVVNAQMKKFSDDILPYQTLASHAMIHHRSLSGVAYRACCEHQGVADKESFDVYLTNINADADFGLSMGKLFGKWFVLSRWLQLSVILIDAMHFSLTKLEAMSFSSLDDVRKECKHAVKQMDNALEVRKK